MWIGKASGRSRTFDISVPNDARVWWEWEWEGEGEGEGFSGKRVGSWMMWDVVFERGTAMVSLRI